MEVTIVIQAEVCLVVDAVELSRARLLNLSVATDMAEARSLLSAHAEVRLALLAQRSQRLARVWDLDLCLHFVDEFHFFFVKDAVGVRYVVALVLVILDVD